MRWHILSMWEIGSTSGKYSNQMLIKVVFETTGTVDSKLMIRTILLNNETCKSFQEYYKYYLFWHESSLKKLEIKYELFLSITEFLKLIINWQLFKRHFAWNTQQHIISTWKWPSSLRFDAILASSNATFQRERIVTYNISLWNKI